MSSAASIAPNHLLMVDHDPDAQAADGSRSRSIAAAPDALLQHRLSAVLRGAANPPADRDPAAGPAGVGTAPPVEPAAPGPSLWDLPATPAPVTEPRL